jgi:hypothetical protein
VLLHGLWIVPLALLIAYLSSPRHRGEIAEARVRRLLAAGLERSRYTVFNDLDVPSGGGTVHVDHVVVSKFGVFVIESQYARGWISGGEFQERWKQYHLGRFTRLDNPLHRNKIQVDALGRLLGLPRQKMHPLVVMVGQKGYKSPMPEQMVVPERLIRHIHRKGQQLLNDEQAVRVIEGLRGPGVVIGGRASGASRRRWLLALLWGILLAGSYLAFDEPLGRWWSEYREQASLQDAADRFHEDGRPRTERELWEDSLVCAYSSDTDRCVCYEPDGERAEVEPARCRSLAQRGSVLQQ